jgi:UDP:flavonoid glycosyltransferase YjiC (YdhE family)
MTEERSIVRVALQAPGTRGDVQPYVALALRLQTRGHEYNLPCRCNLRPGA